MEILPHVSNVVRTQRILMQEQDSIHAVVALTDDDFIKSRIFTVRGIQVVLDRDLAELYGVQTKVLNQAV